MGHPGKIIGITLGDLNGIGPEVVFKALADPAILARLTPVVYGADWVWEHYAKLLSAIPSNCIRVHDQNSFSPGTVNLVHCPVAPFPLTPGVASQPSGAAARVFLQRGVQDAKKGIVDGLATAPVDKKTLYDATGFPHRGHTEYLVHACNVSTGLMMMTGDGLRVGLVTEHIPIKDVAGMITPERLTAKAALFERTLQRDFSIPKPTIAVLGLNPHAGDEGLVGDEEYRVITPVIQRFRHAGKSIFGPFSADGFFAAGHANDYDGVLAMYHDQGLIPFKVMAFDHGVNYTAGLPIVRTSPDHGVAYALAGTNRGMCNSMKQAMYTAVSIAASRSSFD